MPVLLKITFAVFLFVSSFLYCQGVSVAETVLTGKVMATVMRSVPIPFHAIIDEICVKPGTAVAKGTPLLRFHLQSEAQRMLQKEITLGSDTEDLRAKMLELEREKGRLEAQMNKSRQLVASGLGSRQALQRQEKEVRTCAERIEILRTSIAKGNASFSARLRELEQYYTVPLREGMLLPDTTMVLPSPIDGYVLSVSSIFPGTLLPANADPIVVGPLDPMLIQVPVYEGEMNDVKEGSTAQVEIPSLGNKKFTAKVMEISWVSTDMNVSNPSYFTVKLMVPNPNLELKPGFKAVVRF